jgi:hypothetical protein
MELRHPINQNDPFFLRHAPFIAVVDEVLSAGECETLIERIESLSPSFAPITTSRGFVDRPDIRNNDRVIFDDAALAADLFERLRQLLPERLHSTRGSVATATAQASVSRRTTTGTIRTMRSAASSPSSST